MKYAGASTLLASIVPQLLLAKEEPSINVIVKEISIPAGLKFYDTIGFPSNKQKAVEFYVVTGIGKNDITVMSLAVDPKVFPKENDEFLLMGRMEPKRRFIGPESPPHLENPVVWPLYEITEMVEESHGNSYTFKYKPTHFKS